MRILRPHKKKAPEGWQADRGSKTKPQGGGSQMKGNHFPKEGNPSPSKISIELGSDLAASVKATIGALSKLSGKSTVYVHTGHLVRVLGGGAPVHRLTAHALRESMSLAAEYVVKKEVGPTNNKHLKVISKAPPLYLARMIISRGSWPELPEILRISRLPPVTERGSIKPGYDAASKIFYVDGGKIGFGVDE